tara:strand:- start:67 stop:594 length:528 start_codon:yes stop_codon:yes gene_type:complete
MTKQEANKTDTYKAVRKVIEGMYDNKINKFADANWMQMVRELDNEYDKGKNKGINHNDLMTSDSDTLHGLSTGNKDSIFFNAKNILKPTMESVSDDLKSGYKRSSDLDLLSSSAATKYYESLEKENPETGKNYTVAEVDAEFLENFKDTPYIKRILINIKNAYKRENLRLESEED